MEDTYTVYKVTDEKLSHKEHLDNWQEVLEWAARFPFGHIRVVRDRDGKARDALLTTELVQTQAGNVLADVYDWID